MSGFLEVMLLEGMTWRRALPASKVAALVMPDCDNVSAVVDCMVLPDAEIALHIQALRVQTSQSRDIFD